MCAFSDRKRRLRSIQKARPIEAASVCGVSIGASEHRAEPGTGADALQRPLRARFQARLTASVMLLKPLLTLYTYKCTVSA
jgi:hypothetical protein